MGCAPSSSRPELPTIFKIFTSCVAKFSSVVVLFDGLDECGDAQLTDIISLLSQIGALPIKVLITTRPHLAHVEQQFSEVSTIIIRAQDTDVKKYINQRLDKERKIVARLRETIRDKVVGNAHGMYILKRI